MPGRAVAAIVLAAGMLSGCMTVVPSAGVVVQHDVVLPTHSLSAQDVSGFASGGRIRFDGQCVSLDYGDGSSANLVWPSSFHALAPPLAIYGASGRPIISEGDEVELGVSAERYTIPGCPSRAVLLVGEVSSVNGVPWPDGSPARAPIEKPGAN